jgi:hypothetical protein
MEAPAEVLPVKPGLLLDILEEHHPALSSTSDMPVIETKPDSTPAKEPVKDTAVPSTEVVEEAEQLEESATSTTETPGQPTAPRGVGKKIAELTKKISDAEARAKVAEESLRLALERKEEPKPAPTGEDLVKPTRDAFQDPDAYDTAILDYAEKLAESKASKEVERLRTEEATKATKAAEETAARTRLDAYNARVEKTRQTRADFDEVAMSPDVQVSMPVVHAIMTHDQGPEIQYYLGKNPTEAARIVAMTVETPQGPQPDVARQLMEVGLIVAKLNAPSTAPPISKAAPPIKPLKSAPSVEEKDPNEMNMDEYKAWRKGQRH